jgi:phosphate transport system permease protein
MTLSSPNSLFPCSADRWLTIITRACAVISAGVVVMVVVFLTRESLPAFRQIGFSRFLTDASWHPLSGLFNMVPMVAGTALTTMGAMAIAVPLGISSAVFAQFYAPPGIARWHGRLVELLAGIPSVVFGLWGLVVLVPLLAPLGGSGQNLLSATLVLGLMIVPTIALTSHSSLAAVSHELIAGGAALGLRRWAIVWRIAIPAAKAGIRTGLLLATCRAMGETMAVLMLAGNVPELPDSIVSPVRTLTANIALEMGYATSGHRATLLVSGLMLMSIVGLVVLLIDFTGGHRDV